METLNNFFLNNILSTSIAPVKFSALIGRIILVIACLFDIDKHRCKLSMCMCPTGATIDPNSDVFHATFHPVSIDQVY